MTRKKILIIIGAVFFLLILSLVLFLLPGEEPGTVVREGEFFPVTPAGDSGGFFGIGETDPSSDGAFGGFGEQSSVLYAKVTRDAVAGAQPVGREEDLDLKLRYVLRETGHVYEYDPRTNTGKRISNTTMPRVFRVLWNQDTTHLILQSLDGPDNTVRTFAARLATSTGEQGLSGAFLPDNIRDIAISPSGKKAMYILTTGSRSEGHLYDFVNEASDKKIPLPSNEWLVSWPEETKIFFLSRPSASVEGFLYKTDPTTPTPIFQKVLGGFPGLTVLGDKTSTRFLIQESTAERSQENPNAVFSTYVWGKGKSTDFPLTTLPEKCAWSRTNDNLIYCAAPNTTPAGSYPDNWYNGTVSFSDTIWKINLDLGTAETLFTPEITAGESIDAVNLLLDSTEHYLFFTNKKDASLWSLRLDTPTL